jgi:hypothetical protein
LDLGNLHPVALKAAFPESFCGKLCFILFSHSASIFLEIDPALVLFSASGRDSFWEVSPKPNQGES